MKENPKRDEISGIYLWGFKSRNNRFIPYYGGKAWRLKWRLTDHISNILGVNYTIYDPEKIENEDFNREHSKYNAEDFAWKVKWIIDRNALKPYIDYMVDNFYFTYAEMTHNEFKEYADSAEKTLISECDLVGRGNSRCGRPHKPIDLGNLKEIIDEFPLSFSIV